MPAPTNQSGASLDIPLPVEASNCMFGSTRKVIPLSTLLEGLETPDREVSPKNSTKNPVLSVAVIPSATE
jgi:hypothetical protein